MAVHRAADVEEQQHLDRIAPLGPHLDVQPALTRRAVDGAVDVQLLGRAFAGEAAQAAQRHLDVARAQFDRVVQVPVFALLPDLDRAAVAAGAADADALGVVAAVAEGAGSAGADPLVPALVALFLLLQALLQRLHQLVETAERLNLRLLLVGQVFFGQQPQPVLGDVGGDLFAGADALQPLEHLAEDLIEAVVTLLVPDQDGARLVVAGLAVAP